jgi:DMSO/TMAO reductase YedYZ heme-binding membrane subunit
VLLGLLLSSRLLGRRAPAPWVLAVHRGTSGLAVAFTAVHLGALLLDDWVTFTWLDLVVPLASAWRPVAVAWGVVALQLLLAVQLTSLLKARTSHRTWRRVHHLAGPAWVLGTVHLLAAGTDATHPVVLAVVGSTSAVVLFLALVRAHSPRGRFPRPEGARPTPARRPATRAQPASD